MKITKSNLKEFIATRDTKTTLLINIFTKWLYHYIVSLYENSKTAREFQKKLYNIPSWSSTKEREFKQFLKMTFKKFNLIEDQLYDTLQEVFVLNVKILSKSDLEIDIPKLPTFWFKLLKYTGKYFYEHPTDLEVNEKINIKYITKLVQDTILKYIPIKDLFNITKVAKFEYNFDENDTHNSNLILNQQNHIQSEVLSEKSSSLKYISSEQFLNEYYNPELNKSENDDKEIKLQIKKKNLV
jgi:hypothetical protein